MPKVERREEILRAACRLFSQNGYHGTTIRDISEACGILAGSLYAHIRSKEDLLYEITDRGASSFLNSLRPIVEEEGKASQKLKLALRVHMQVVAENLEATTVFFHEWKALTSNRREQIQKKRDIYEDMWNQILIEGIKQGEFKDVDVKLARLLILSVGNWLYEWYRPDGSLSAEEIANKFAELILSGFVHTSKGM